MNDEVRQVKPVFVLPSYSLFRMCAPISYNAYVERPQFRIRYIELLDQAAKHLNAKIKVSDFSLFEEIGFINGHPHDRQVLTPGHPKNLTYSPIWHWSQRASLVDRDGIIVRAGDPNMAVCETPYPEFDRLKKLERAFVARELSVHDFFEEVGKIKESKIGKWVTKELILQTNDAEPVFYVTDSNPYDANNAGLTTSNSVPVNFVSVVSFAEEVIKLDAVKEELGLVGNYKSKHIAADLCSFFRHDKKFAALKQGKLPLDIFPRGDVAGYSATREGVRLTTFLQDHNWERAKLAEHEAAIDSDRKEEAIETMDWAHSVELALERRQASRDQRQGR